MSFVSYAQNFEDVMLFRALRDVEKGFYIDVGAQDPVIDSVTKAFYQAGWRGINIEPVGHWFELLEQDRRHDINLQAAVSDRPGDLHLFEVVGSGLSTVDPDFAARHAHAGFRIREYDVSCVTLDAVCERYGVGEVHFLKIDCEGCEAAALRGISLSRTRPWIILVESTEPNSQVPSFEDWEPILLENNYSFAYADGLNRFYLANERGGLKAAFANPPNVFDNFIRSGHVEISGELAAAKSKLDQYENIERAVRAEDQRDSLASQLAVISEKLLQAERTLVEKVDGMARLEIELQHLETELRQTRADQLEMKDRNDALSLAIGEERASRQDLAYRLQHLGEDNLRLGADFNRMLNSRSWRYTAPFRLIARSLRGDLSAKEVAKKVVVHLAEMFARSRAITKLFKYLLFPLPGFKARLRGAILRKREASALQVDVAVRPEPEQPLAIPLSRSAEEVLSYLHAELRRTLAK